MFSFTASDQTSQVEIKVPYFEAARADNAPYYRVLDSYRDIPKQTRRAQEDVETEMAKLGGRVERFVEGSFKISGQTRYGYKVEFRKDGHPGVIHTAGLPIRDSVTDLKKAQVLVQALLIVRDWLKAAVTAQVFSPGSDPLLPHMLVPGSQMTIAQYIASERHLPMLNPPPEVVEGEIVE